MLDVCPLCGTPLRNGLDRPQYIIYDPTQFAEKQSGDRVEVKVYYDRVRLCPNMGNNNTVVKEDGAEVLVNPPCPNYYGVRGGTIENPDVIVEEIQIEDN